MLKFRQFVYSFLLQWSLTVVEHVNLLSVFSRCISITVKIHIPVNLFCLLGVVLNHDVWWICFLLASVARFLESRGMLEDALEVATDPNYRFDLAVQLGRLEVAKVCLFWPDLCLWIQLKTQCCYYFPWYLTLQNFWLSFICFWGYWFSLHPFKTAGDCCWSTEWIKMEAVGRIGYVYWKGVSSTWIYFHFFLQSV